MAAEGESESSDAWVARIGPKAAALKSITMFDNLMWSRGVSPEGRYVPQPSKTWVGNSTGRFGVGKMH